MAFVGSHDQLQAPAGDVKSDSALSATATREGDNTGHLELLKE